MKKIIIFLFVIFCVVDLQAQKEPLTDDKPKAQHVEKVPEYPGGDEAMQKFIVENVVYPKKAIKEKITGTVKVSFVVEKDGSVSGIKVSGKKVGGGCDEEAMRVVALFPKFTPGTQDGKPVKVRMTVPIKFKLQ